MEGLPKIKLIGVGGAGCRIADKMLDLNLTAVEYYAVDDDFGSLQRSECKNKVQLAGGNRAGADYEACEKTALSYKRMLSDAVKGADMVILVAGAGGGFGSAVAPVIADIAKENNILTVATVCSPFPFEGKERHANAERSISALKEKTDTTIVVPCGTGKLLSSSKLTKEKELTLVDAMIESALFTVISPATVPGVVNIDYEDVVCALKEAGETYFGVGASKGENRGLEAAKGAIDCPLSGIFPKDANRVILSIETGDIPPIAEVDEVIDYCTDLFEGSLNLFTSVQVNESLGDNMKVSVLAIKNRKSVKPTEYGGAEDNFSEELKAVLRSAETISEGYGLTYVATEEIVYAMLMNECIAGKILDSCGVDFIRFAEYFNRVADSGCKVCGYTPRTKHLIERAKELAADTDGEDAKVGTEHLLLSILTSTECLAMRILHAIGTDIKKLAGMLEKVLGVN